MADAGEPSLPASSAHTHRPSSDAADAPTDEATTAAIAELLNQDALEVLCAAHSARTGAR